MLTPPGQESEPSLFDTFQEDVRTPEGVLTVSELTGGLRTVVEDHYSDVLVEGELSNFKRAASGHCYFTLKDEDAQISCVMWRHYTQYVFFEPEDGMLVRVRGDVSVYERRGDLQIVTRSMRLAGEGALQKAFQALKRRLEAEGLFDPDHKRSLPRFPRVVGVVTSGTGAALHDVLSILERRFPCVEVLVCPVQVQGVGAATAIAEAIAAFNTLTGDRVPRPDVLIVGRGGGSLEDLWAFNEEVVARAIYASTIPVVSAVGHETDFSIADFVADRRAATPSMAAEIVVPDRREVAAGIAGAVEALEDGVLARVDGARRRIERLVHAHAFRLPLDRLHAAAQRVDDLVARLDRAGIRQLERARHRLAALDRQLAILDPSRLLQSGYVRVTRSGTPIHAVAAVAVGDVLSLHFSDGTAGVRVEHRQVDDREDRPTRKPST